nr:nuclear-pore anchor [Tanacetum cinerariifolium]
KLQSSKNLSQLLQLIEHKDLEINEKNSSIKGYLDKIVALTDTASAKESQINKLKAEHSCVYAPLARLSQEKESSRSRSIVVRFKFQWSTLERCLLMMDLLRHLDMQTQGSEKLPYTIRILLKSAIRNCDNFQLTKEDTLLACVILGRDYSKINPLVQFTVRAKDPNGEVQIYTWMDATIRELTDHGKGERTTIPELLQYVDRAVDARRSRYGTASSIYHNKIVDSRIPLSDIVGYSSTLPHLKGLQNRDIATSSIKQQCNGQRQPQNSVTKGAINGNNSSVDIDESDVDMPRRKPRRIVCSRFTGKIDDESDDDLTFDRFFKTPTKGC